MACRCWNGNEMNGRWGVSACLIEIQWQKWPKLSEGLLQIAASEALPRFVSVLFFFFLFTVFEFLFFPFPPSLPIFFFSIYPSLLLPRHWNGFWNEISQITIFQTAAMCFLHMRCYRSNRAIIHPPAVWCRLRCINLAWHVRPGISFMLSVPVLVDWCNCKLVCRWISLVLLLLLFFLWTVERGLRVSWQVTDSVSCANSPCNTDTFPSNSILEAKSTFTLVFS